jgi:hypothetical protein
MSGYITKRTTVRLDEALIESAKAGARLRHKTLTRLIEEGLHRVLAELVSKKRGRKVVLPAGHESGGVMAGVDLNNSAGILDIMDELR